MDVIPVGHESRRQRYNIEPDRATNQIQVETDVLFRIGLIAMRVEIRRNVAVSGGELRVQVAESRAKPHRQRCADGGLAGASGTNQLNQSIPSILSGCRHRAEPRVAGT